MRGDKLSKHFMIVDGEKREIKSMYVGLNGEAVEVWNKEQGVLRKDLYELNLRSMIQISGTQEILIDQMLNQIKLEENNVKEEESLWQKLLKLIRPKKSRK